MEWSAVPVDACEDQLPRSGHMMVNLPDDHAADLLVFGGYTEDVTQQVKSKMPPFADVPKREPTNGPILVSLCLFYCRH